MEIAIGFVLILLLGAIISGAIGAFLGGSVNKGMAGFWLGFFLGPIGWIIVLLLPRETSNRPQAQTQKPKERSSSQTKATDEGPPRDLTSDAYKIWLGKKYEISRNELFDNFECNEKLFESLDEALKYADYLEALDRQRREAAKPKLTSTKGYVLASDYAKEVLEGTDYIIGRIKSGSLEGRVINERWYVKVDD